MKNKFCKIAGLVLSAVLLIGAVVGISISAADENDPEIIAQNLVYGEKISVAYAVKAEISDAISGAVGVSYYWSDETAENAKKPQNSTSFAPTTLALSKIAAYIKETDEIVTDAPFLASEVQNSLLYQLGVVEDATLIGAVAGTSGIQSGTYGAGSSSVATTIADGILYAIKAVKGASAYDASAIIINPADMFALQIAKDSNLQYIGGGYFTGAYGNGNYEPVNAIWGVPVFESTAVSAGDVLVVAKQAVKVWAKGGVDVKLYEQNEDDAIYNRVTLLAEERVACAVVDLKGVYLLEAE